MEEEEEEEEEEQQQQQLRCYVSSTWATSWEKPRFIIGSLSSSESPLAKGERLIPRRLHQI
jgi:hypothetical protein